MYTRTTKNAGDTKPKPPINNAAVESADTVKREPVRVRAIPPDYAGTSMRFDDSMFSDTGESPYVPEAEIEAVSESVEYDFSDADATIESEQVFAGDPPPDDNENRGTELDREAAFDAIYAPFLAAVNADGPRSSDYAEPVIIRRGDYAPPSNPSRSADQPDDGERSGEAMLNLSKLLPSIKSSVADDDLLLTAMIILLLMSDADDDLIIILAFLLMSG